jgi:hypothetical protein
MNTKYIRVFFLLLVNRLYWYATASCRMYDKKPDLPRPNCYLCAIRGGYFRCRRSKQLVRQAVAR